MISERRVAVLLCTFNGARHLAEQLQSIASQSLSCVDSVCDVFVSDDGSSDETLGILESFAESKRGLSSLNIRQGPSCGHTPNFLSLVTADDINADFFAFCDQDDIWDSDKLARAVTALQQCSEEHPALYCTRTRSISEAGELIGSSPLFARPPSFANALVQNIAGGNTMVINRAAKELMTRAGRVDVPCHDWWCYQLISGAGGKVIYDSEPSLSYRQHADNQIGANVGLGRRLLRYCGALSGRNRVWNDQNLKALLDNAELLNESSLHSLAVFDKTRSQSLLRRLTGLKRAGLYAQTTSGNIGLFIASLLKKI